MPIISCLCVSVSVSERVCACSSVPVCVTGFQSVGVYVLTQDIFMGPLVETLTLAATRPCQLPKT